MRNWLQVSVLGSFVMANAAFALDPACEPVVKASEAKIAQPAWHGITDEEGGMHMEALKSDGQFYHQIDGAWMKSSADLDKAEQIMIGQIRNGVVKISQCKVLGNEVIDGAAVTVLAHRVEIAGAPPAESKLYIGKSDGLPYRNVSGNVTVVYRYKGVTAPRI